MPGARGSALSDDDGGDDGCASAMVSAMTALAGGQIDGVGNLDPEFATTDTDATTNTGSHPRTRVLDTSQQLSFDNFSL